jgi:hypothetical protein
VNRLLSGAGTLSIQAKFDELFAPKAEVKAELSKRKTKARKAPEKTTVKKPARKSTGKKTSTKTGTPRRGKKKLS